MKHDNQSHTLKAAEMAVRTYYLKEQKDYGKGIESNITEPVRNQADSQTAQVTGTWRNDSSGNYLHDSSQSLAKLERKYITGDSSTARASTASGASPGCAGSRTHTVNS
jgi:hypothetical protein